MDSQVRSFSEAYPKYYELVEKLTQSLRTILEVGAGAYPTVCDRSSISYTIIDPDQSELSKAPEDITKINSSVEDHTGKERYDLILSKMVLEHLSNPDTFHRRILELLTSDGRVVHFFACRNSLPGFANRVFPESVGEKILRILGNRNTDTFPKYPAYYRRTKGGVSSQIRYFESLGYTIETYTSFVGHKYFKSIPILNWVEKVYTDFLVFLKMKSLATVALIVLKRNDEY